MSIKATELAMECPPFYDTLLLTPPYSIGTQNNPHPSSPSVSLGKPLTMDHSSTFPAFVPVMGSNDHTAHPWVLSQRTQQPGEQYLPSTAPAYVSHINHPSTSYTQTRVVDYNHESKVCGQQTNTGVRDPLTISLERLDHHSTFAAASAAGLKEIIFLGPHHGSTQLFLESKDVFMTRVIHILRNARSLKKVTFPLDFTDLNGILATLATIPGMQEITLTLPTASKLGLHSIEMIAIQHSFIAGLGCFRHLNRLTMPMEFVTALLLSHLAKLPNLESLTIKYSPPPRPDHYQSPFPAWSSYRLPAECPGYIFIAHLNFDPRGYFRQLARLDLGAPLSDASYTTLKTLFPKTHIC